MQARRVISVILVTATGVAGALNAPWLIGAAESPTARTMNTDFDSQRFVAHVTGVGPWVAYQDPTASLGLTFEYPQNWVTGTDIGRNQAYWQLIILGPRNAKNTWSAGLTIRKRSTTGLYQSLELRIERHLKQAASAPQFQLLEEGSRQVGVFQTWQMTWACTVPLPPHSAQATTPTPIQTRLVIFAIGEHLYELNYSADAKEYPAYQHVFDHLLDTLKPAK